MLKVGATGTKIEDRRSSSGSPSSVTSFMEVSKFFAFIL
jgi:hypothetical protein